MRVSVCKSQQVIPLQSVCTQLATRRMGGRERECNQEQERERERETSLRSCVTKSAFLH